MKTKLTTKTKIKDPVGRKSNISLRMIKGRFPSTKLENSIRFNIEDMSIFSKVEKKKVEISLQIKKRLEAQGKFDKASFVFKQLANC